MNLFGETCTLINRMAVPLPITQDGHEIVLQPGENPNIDRSWIRYAKNQHPVMGTDKPFTINHFESKVALKGSKDPCEPISYDPKTGRSECVSRLDHSHLPDAVVESTGFRADMVRPTNRIPVGEVIQA